MIYFLAAMIAGYAGAATADGQSSLKTRDVLKAKTFSEDKQITDNELKAQAGSLSRYSMKFDLSYQGPPVGNLSDASVPNPDNRPMDDRTSLSGYMGFRYRMSPNDAINMSTGLKVFTPYQRATGQDVEKEPGAKDYDVTNPQVSYDRTYAAGGAQWRSSVKAVWITAKYFTDRGEYAALGLAQSAKYNMGNFILGMIADVDFYAFNREYRRSDGRISNYYMSMIPSVEYRLTDRLNLRTSVAYSLSNMRRKGNWLDWEPIQPTARTGIGWAVTREIYFSPYLSYYWERPAWRTTAMSFSTVFSIF